VCPWWKREVRRIIRHKVISNDKSFYGNFETRGILRRFLNKWYFTEVLKHMVFNGGFKTNGILHRC